MTKPNDTLGTLSRQREMQILQIIFNYPEKIPGHEIDRKIWGVPLFSESQPPGSPPVFTLYSVTHDLQHYGLIEIEGSDGWYTYSITEKGKELLAYYESQNALSDNG